MKEEDEVVEYIVIKIGDKVYSTTFSEIRTGKDISVAKKQLVITDGIGSQDNLWIKGKFTEGKNHVKLDEDINFEINIYTETKSQEVKQNGNNKRISTGI